MIEWQHAPNTIKNVNETAQILYDLHLIRTFLRFICILLENVKKITNEHLVTSKAVIAGGNQIYNSAHTRDQQQARNQNNNSMEGGLNRKVSFFLFEKCHNRAAF